MALTVVTQSNVSGTVLPALAAKALHQLTSHRQLPRLISTGNDLEPEKPRTMGDTIKVMTPSTFSAADKSEDAEFTVQSGSISTADLSINKWKTVPIRVSDKAKLFSSVSAVRKLSVNMANALIRQVNADVAAEYSNAAGTAVNTYGNTLDGTDMRNLWQYAAEADCAHEDISVVFAPAAYKELLAVSDFTKVNEYGPKAVIADGELGDIYGMRCFWNPGIKTSVVSATTRYHNMAFHKSAIVWAPVLAPLPDKDSGVQAATAQLVDTDNETAGFSVRVMLSYDHKEMCEILSMDLLYGIKTVRSATLWEVKR